MPPVILQNLDQLQAIVTERGTPTQYFIRFIQNRGGALTDLDAVITAILDTQIIAGAGLDGGGQISDGVITLNANASDILDLLTNVQGSVLFRGATEWEFLLPGSANEYLKTNGPAADPEWDTPTGGGGGDWPPNGAWTPITWGASGTYHGLTLFPSNETFAVGNGQGVEVRGWFPRVRDQEIGLWISDLTNGITTTAQTDNNNVFYRYSAAVQTSLQASGINAGNDYTGFVEFYMRLHKTAASDYSTFAKINEGRYLVNNQNQAITAWNLGTCHLLARHPSGVSGIVAEYRTF